MLRCDEDEDCDCPPGPHPAWGILKAIVAGATPLVVGWGLHRLSRWLDGREADEDETDDEGE